ncbi:MAG: PH domain-containing protein [Cohnella sp.]|nr:PH domain-containing protein [Cohnella sp.]
MQAENTLWEGKPFNYGIPTFTRYQLTDRRLIVERGIFTKRREEIQLYRIRDISLKRNLIERLLKFGDITILSTDSSSPTYTLKNIRDSVAISDLISQTAETSRQKNRAMELTEVQS